MRTWLFNAPKKRALILYEILIALSLTAILLTFLFSFFVESAKIEQKLDAARMTVIDRAHLQTRLQTILSSVCYDLPRVPLYTQDVAKETQSSLIAVFDNGIDPEPAYSGAILGRIFLDENHNFSLATWPLEQVRPWRKEILLSGVEQFQFEFLGPNDAAYKEKIRPINGQLAWWSHWPSERKQIPSMIRLTIVQKTGSLHFAFILPAPSEIITYVSARGK